MHHHINHTTQRSGHDDAIIEWFWFLRKKYTHIHNLNILLSFPKTIRYHIRKLIKKMVINWLKNTHTRRHRWWFREMEMTNRVQWWRVVARQKDALILQHCILHVQTCDISITFPNQHESSTTVVDSFLHPHENHHHRVKLHSHFRLSKKKLSVAVAKKSTLFGGEWCFCAVKKTTINLKTDACQSS